MADEPDWLQPAMIYAAGLELVEPMGYFADHYGLRPGGAWFPRGRTTEEVGQEVDTMIEVLSRSLDRAQTLMHLAHGDGSS